MKRMSLSDLALLLAFTVILPLSMGAWWRYFSGHYHPEQQAVSEQGLAVNR